MELRWKIVSSVKAPQRHSARQTDPAWERATHQRRDERNQRRYRVLRGRVELRSIDGRATIVRRTGRAGADDEDFLADVLLRGMVRG